VTRAYWPALGGQENYLRHVARGLSQEHDVTVLAQTNTSDSGVEGRLAGLLRPYPPFSPYQDGAVMVRQIRIPASRMFLLGPSGLMVVRPFSRYAYTLPARSALARLYAAAVRTELRAGLESVEVVHMWGADVLGFATLKAARALGKPTVMTPFAHPGQHGDDRFSASCYRMADRVVGLLHCDAALYGQLGVAQARLRVLPVCSPGVPHGDLDVRTAHDVLGPLVLFLAVRRHYKGLDVLLRALSVLAERLPNATLAVAGPGEPVVGKHPIRVIDLGQPNDDVAGAWIRAADVLCLPSMHEIFPVSFLEAWSAGTAVVGSDIQALDELIRRSGGGIPVRRDERELGALLGSLLADRKRCRSLGQAGREWWSANATPPQVVAEHAALYEDVLSVSRQPPPRKAIL
jgi:glycosyltransferase involved in cell wall biosynthesis